jgi:hypothetical protein
MLLCNTGNLGMRKQTHMQQWLVPSLTLLLQPCRKGVAHGWLQRIHLSHTAMRAMPASNCVFTALNSTGT